MATEEVGFEREEKGRRCKNERCRGRVEEAKGRVCHSSQESLASHASKIILMIVTWGETMPL